MKKITALILVVLLLIPLSLQVTEAHAEDPPLTGPVTAPISFFNLTGKVTIKQLGHFFRNARRVLPAEGVIVKVKSLFHKSTKYTTTTDEDGMYAFDLPKGHYIVEVKEQDDIFFVPPLRVVHLKPGDTKVANFQGLSFH